MKPSTYCLAHLYFIVIPLSAYSLKVYCVIVASDHTQGHTHTHTFGRTPLYEESVRRRGLYLQSTQHSQETNICAPCGIRTCSPNKRAASGPNLRPHGSLYI